MATKAKFGHDRKVSLSARAACAAMLAVSTEETRFYLQGIHVEPCREGGVLIVATNGHLLIAVHDANGETNGSWICPIPDAVRRFLLANLEPGVTDESRGWRFDEAHEDEEDTDEYIIPRPKRITFEGNLVSVFAPESAVRDESPEEMVIGAQADAIDGTFPDWRRVLPHDSPKIDAARAMIRAYWPTRRRIEAKPNAALRPVLIGAYSNPNTSSCA